ncbi:MAG: hypothetical protein KC646_16955 [Candidatus Cloacimonetes bacterium]|nr:hypothetical protein [Candidatus Cloacimonadota bacterium]
MKSYIKLNALVLILLVNHSYSIGFLKHQVKRILRIDKRGKFDKRRCVTKPELYYGHFVNEMVYPDEIHTFYINTKSPKSKAGIGKDLKPVVRRVLSIDEKYKKNYDSFAILKIKACVPSESFLKPSYREENSMMGLESHPNSNLRRREKNYYYKPYR